jgi:hypothetical protein
MQKLKKAEFDKTYRFREARRRESGEKSLVNCFSCANMPDGAGDKEPAYCNHPERFRRVKIAEYFRGYFGDRGESRNIALGRVCDCHTPEPLPEGVSLPIVPEKHLILLGSQSRDICHADSNCPYVVEEARAAMAVTLETIKREKLLDYLKRPGIHIKDRPDLVPDETIGWQICEMPCCNNKLPYHTWRIDDYRRRVGIKPDGSEEKPWVRKVIDHERKIVMTPEEAEAVFDLTRFNSSEFRDIHHRISAVSDYLHKHCNRLGSRPLGEAFNPVYLISGFHILKDSLNKANADVWVYDGRLFDAKKGLEIPLEELERIPEGIVPCMDRHGVFSNARFHCQNEHFGSFYFYGIVKPSPENLALKGASHFIEIGAVKYRGYEHMWGEFGKGFNGLASFHEE